MSPLSLTAETVCRTETGETRIARDTAAYRRMALALLMAGFSTFALLYDVQPLLPLFAGQFGINAANASLSVSFATGAMALSFIPAGILSDRIGRLPVMTISLLASALLTILSAALPGWTTLLVMRALTGIALAGVPSVAMAYVSEEVDAVSVGSAMGLYIAGSAIGGMAGRLGMTLIAEHFGWRGAVGVGLGRLPGHAGQGTGLLALSAVLLYGIEHPGLGGRLCLERRPVAGGAPLLHRVGADGTGDRRTADRRAAA